MSLGIETISIFLIVLIAAIIFALVGAWFIKKYKKEDEEKTGQILSLLLSGVYAGVIAAFLVSIKDTINMDLNSETAILDNIGSYALYLGFFLLMMGIGLAVLWHIQPHSVKNKKKTETQIKKDSFKLPNIGMLQLIKEKFWFILTLLIFLVFWYVLLDGYPILVNTGESSVADLPTKELSIHLSDGGYLSIQCHNGEVFEDKLIQGDIIECSFRESAVGSHVKNETITVNVAAGEAIEDYQENKEWYVIPIAPEDITNEGATFWTKVPPVERFTFFVQIPGYYSDISAEEYWYPTTKFDEYLRNSLPNIQLLIMLFGVFGAMKFLRDLWQNK